MNESSSALVVRLRAAGCVFAEEEAAILLEDDVDEAELERRVRRRESGEPLEHVVGWVRFGPLRLRVGPGVFVPRQRSLLLARAAVRVARSQAQPVMLEPYSGVAPIAATVAAAVPGAELHAADIDAVALGYARHNLPAGAGIHRSDRLDGVPDALRGRVTLLAGVPPYVPHSASATVPREARDHEPERALFAGDDGLDHVRAVIGAARDILAPDGRVLLELHRGQYAPAAALARGTGWRTARRPGRDGQTVLLDLAAG